MCVVNTISPNLSRISSKTRGWNILRANNPLHAGINHRKRAPCEIRGISLKGGRTSRTGTGPCQIQNPFDRQTYRTESFYSFHPWLILCSVEKPLPTPFQSPSSSQREIFTNISQLKTRSRRRCSQYPLECQLTVDFPASFFPAIFEDALPPRLSHHRERIAPEIRERIVFVCRSLTSRSLRATNFSTCFIHLWKYFSSIIDKKKELRAFYVILSIMFKYSVI